MRIRTKIFALVGGLGLVAGLIAGVAIDTVRTYDATVRAVDEGATRAHHSEHLNRLVTAVVMESRGIYAARDSQDAKRFAQGLTTYLDEIDALLAVWQPLVPESDRALFNAVKASAAEFRAFRTETARLGLEVGPKAANEQGNNDANRANRKAFQDSIDALTKHSREGVEALRAGTQSLYDGRLALLVGLAFGGVVGAIALAALLGQRQIAGPLHQVTAALQKLAAGDRTLPEVQLKQDEIGDIWRTMRVFADAMAETERLRPKPRGRRGGRAAPPPRDGGPGPDLRGDVGDVLRQVQASAEEMRVATGVVNNSAEEVTGQSAAVGRSAERAAAGVGSAAAAAEELTASIDEIASHMEQSAAASRQAVDETKVTNGVVRQLSEAAQKVGDIVNLISDIAAQTNLLALNATIEAARAGEAGKGFAVVAQEVKSLATQTARATGDISAQIAAIQNSTGATVDAIGRIGGRIEEMNAISTSIASGRRGAVGGHQGDRPLGPRGLAIRAERRQRRHRHQPLRPGGRLGGGAALGRHRQSRPADGRGAHAGRRLPAEGARRLSGPAPRPHRAARRPPAGGPPVRGSRPAGGIGSGRSGAGSRRIEAILLSGSLFDRMISPEKSELSGSCSRRPQMGARKPRLTPRDVLSDGRIALMLPLGFSAGLPFLLVFGTLSAWLREAGVSRTEIGLLSWVGFAYTWKFLWAPVIDRYEVPVPVAPARAAAGLDGARPDHHRGRALHHRVERSRAAIWLTVVCGLPRRLRSATQDVVDRRLAHRRRADSPPGPDGRGLPARLPSRADLRRRRRALRRRVRRAGAPPISPWRG